MRNTEENNQWLIEYINAVDDYRLIEALADPELPILLEQNFTVAETFSVVMTNQQLNELRLLPRLRAANPQAKEMSARLAAAARSPQAKPGEAPKLGDQIKSAAHQDIAAHLSKKFGRNVSVDQVRNMARAANALKARGFSPREAAKIAQSNLKQYGSQIMSKRDATPMSQRPSFKSVPIPGTRGVQGGPSYTTVGVDKETGKEFPMKGTHSAVMAKKFPEPMRSPETKPVEMSPERRAEIIRDRNPIRSALAQKVRTANLSIKPGLTTSILSGGNKTLTIGARRRRADTPTDAPTDSPAAKQGFFSGLVSKVKNANLGSRLGGLVSKFSNSQFVSDFKQAAAAKPSSNIMRDAVRGRYDLYGRASSGVSQIGLHKNILSMNKNFADTAAGKAISDVGSRFGSRATPVGQTAKIQDMLRRSRQNKIYLSMLNMDR